jgi:hypothetical protein
LPTAPRSLVGLTLRTVFAIAVGLPLVPTGRCVLRDPVRPALDEILLRYSVICRPLEQDRRDDRLADVVNNRQIGRLGVLALVSAATSRRTFCRSPIFVLRS